MKYCTHCGKEILDEAVICVGCGCATEAQPHHQSIGVSSVDRTALVDKLAQRVNTNGIIWLVIGILQILGGISFDWFMLIVGVLNIISSVQDMQYSKNLKDNPKGIVAKFEPLTGPIIVLVYNLLIGGIIGVIGSIYYFTAVRGFVMENKQTFT